MTEKGYFALTYTEIQYNIQEFNDTGKGQSNSYETYV